MSIDPTRSRRARLDQEAVLQAAEALVDRDGYDALTMTSLATELEARVSSLYNHVANLEDLRALIQVRAMRLLGDHVRKAAMGHAGLTGLRALSHALRAFARTHPQRYAALTRPPIDREAFYAAALDAIEALAVMVRSAGLPDDRLLQSAMALFASLHGFVSLEVAGYFGDLSGTSAESLDLDQVYEQVIDGAVSAASLEATR
ncbi:TetR/AcrR family transcriptional regulator [Pimelobacter simplex]|uniref:Transcriptional regulator, TetR family n=1 Tax=Nocardioides simplex TaxID=2045 RepID=A0A0A1DKX8_NOCSI|nr:TetR/AcrR family transcriptional regulator [Pimelobacter simplex]AIY17312.1 Transcriptional regulator, TetR family [Pimelobacter simplex]GEB13356.1 putative transcriptional regulator, TetR family protein [Pimelobacter simplex]SFM45953.1 transcriptional regulator, TetR family [Pimelobacter simplex]